MREFYRLARVNFTGIVLSILVIALAAPTGVKANICGDINGDGVVTRADSRLVAKLANGRVDDSVCVDADVPEDFTLMLIPDTQNYAAYRPDNFTQQTEWIMSQKDALNIQYVAHLGDCVQGGDSREAEWRNANRSMSKLEEGPNFGLPYGIAVGNHDQSYEAGTWVNQEPGSTDLYNQYFGIDRFAGRPYYGGWYGYNNDNHYDLFEASGLKFIVIYLKFNHVMQANDPVLTWMDALLASHHDRFGIIVTHWLADPGMNAEWSPQGRIIYDVAKHHPNVFMMLGGHIHNEGRRTDVYNGSVIHSLVSNYQGRFEGGTGWLRYYEISPSRKTIQAITYSTQLHEFEVDAGSFFTLPFDFETD